MYHHSLRIVIFSKNPLLEEEIRAISPLARFTHDIRRLEEFLPSAAATADLVIFDVPLKMSFKALRARVKSSARLIACLTQEQEDKLTDEDIHCLDDVWLTPLRVPRIRLRMHNILYEIKRDADARQHMIWLDTLIDSMPDLVWFKDLDGVHHKVNSRFCEFVKKGRDMVEGSTHARIWDVPEDEAEEEEFTCRASENAAIESGSTYLTDEVVKSGGQKHLLKTYKTPLKGADGEILGTVGFAHDLTNLLNLDMELNFFIESMPFPLALCDNNDVITQVNTRFQEYFKTDKKDVAGISFPEWEKGIFHVTVSPVSGEHYLRFRHGRGKMRYVSVTKKNIMDIFGKKVGAFKIFRDITAEKELEIRIWNDANTDALTGLANRHAFGVFMRKLNRTMPVHLVYIDLDEFKAVNDRWGHKAGDEALKIVAKAIRNVFGQDFPVRLGGDEFVICVQRDVPLSELENLADKLLSRIQRKFESSDHLDKMSASIGIRFSASLDEPIDLLIRQADRAMYEAKKLGKGQYCVWNDSMVVE
ncbi:MAG: diguanylate cyclase [Desulfovibrio sp.]|nr:diguanylate cyclase [Desulfovibrio sp.]